MVSVVVTDSNRRRQKLLFFNGKFCSLHRNSASMAAVGCRLLVLVAVTSTVQSAWWPPSQLADNTSCVAAGVDPKGYRQMLTLPNTYNSSSLTTVFAPLFASVSLSDSTTPNENITHAAVYIHGLSADANIYFCDALAAVKATGIENALVVAPWFGNAQATAADWVSGGDPSYVSAYWNTARWVSGGNNSPEPKKYTTTFDILDHLMAELARLKTVGKFPNLKRITVNGFSAGAQLASRWALFSSHAHSVDPVVVRTVVADGSSYVYLDGTRPSPSCTPSTDTGVEHTCNSFEAPNASLCPEYNQYKYGIDISQTESNLYLDSFKANSSLITTAIKAYLASDQVRFLFGDQDVCNCNTEGYENRQSQICYPLNTSCSPNQFGGTLNGTACCDTYPDTLTDNALAVGCESLLMGTNRLQRGINYMMYLNQLRSSDITYGFFNGGHSNAAFYASDLFKQWVYGDDS